MSLIDFCQMTLGSENVRSQVKHINSKMCESSFNYNNNYQMQEKNSFKPNSIMSVQSRPSNFSNCRSLGRPSYQLKQHSLGKKVSLIYVMSIQSERRSDIYEKLLQSEKKPKNRISNIINGTYYDQQNNQVPYQRNSQKNNNQNQIQIQHECKCFDGCLQGQCQCYYAKNQMCVTGLCCKQCIFIKNQLLKSVYQQQYHQQYQYQNGQSTNNDEIKYQQSLEYQQNEIQYSCNCKNTQCLKSYCKCFQQGRFCSDKCNCESCKNKKQSQQRSQALQAIKNNGEVLFCTCKKTKCNKKYCTCYAAGQKCSKLCSCESCTNCLKVSMDLQQMECCMGEQNYDNVQMPVQMDFEPFTFS